jgi:hypothetical protein
LETALEKDMSKLKIKISAKNESEEIQNIEEDKVSFSLINFDRLLINSFFGQNLMKNSQYKIKEVEEITHNTNSDSQSETSEVTMIQNHVPGELVEQPTINYPESLCSYVSAYFIKNQKL